MEVKSMARVNAQQWLDKWGRRTTAAIPDILSGVDRTTKDPGALAAAARPLWVARMTDPATADAWASNVSRVGAANWKNAVKAKTPQRLASGIAQAQATKVARITATLSAVDAAVADANATPRGDITQNLQRANTFALSMSKRAPRRTGG
jgi:hypothetical protein